MFVRPPRPGIRRDLRAEARARIRRQVAQVRRDAGVLSHPVRTASGSLILEGRIASSAPLLYLRDGRPVTEWRGDDELRSIAKQATGKPLVVEHPDGMLAEGAHAPIAGRILHARFDPGDPAYVVASIEVTDPDAIAAIDGGMRELSIGYRADVREDGEQVGIVLDHLALTSRGRCGPSCSVRSDCAGGSCGCTKCTEKRLAEHPLFKESPVSPRKPARDPLTDMSAAEDRARRRDPSATFRSTGERTPEPTTSNPTPEHHSTDDDDLTSMEAAERRAFLRQ